MSKYASKILTELESEFEKVDQRVNVSLSSIITQALNEWRLFLDVWTFCLWWTIKKQLPLKIFKKIDLLHIVSIVVLMKRNFSDEANPFFAATPSSEDPNLLSTDPRSLFGDSDDSDWEGLDGGMIVIWARAWQNQQNDLCAQQRLRSTWASAQSDQSLHCALYGY